MRKSYADYGLSEEQAKTLLRECRSGKHAREVRIAADEADSFIAGYIVDSIMQGTSYERLGSKMCRAGLGYMPCGQSDFYGARRYAIAILAKMLDEEG